VEDSSSPRETEVPRGWGRHKRWRAAMARDGGRSIADWDGQTAARHREVVTHEHGMKETSVYEDLIFFRQAARGSEVSDLPDVLMIASWIYCR
jgi:hypothetical protein